MQKKNWTVVRLFISSGALLHFILMMISLHKDVAMKQESEKTICNLIAFKIAGSSPLVELHEKKDATRMTNNWHQLFSLHSTFFINIMLAFDVVSSEKWWKFWIKAIKSYVRRRSMSIIKSGMNQTSEKLMAQIIIIIKKLWIKTQN